MGDPKSGIVYIDVGWRRALDEQRRLETDEPEISVCWNVGDPDDVRYPTVTGAAFRTVSDAVGWARQRASLVLVRFGPTEDQVYSAGERVATRELPEEGGTDLTPYPEWQP